MSFILITRLEPAVAGLRPSDENASVKSWTSRRGSHSEIRRSWDSRAGAVHHPLEISRRQAEAERRAENAELRAEQYAAKLRELGIEPE
jgi:hypothetical protein